MRPFVVVEHVERRGQVQQLIGRQTKLSTLRVMVIHVIVDGKRFIHQDPAGLQRSHDGREQRAMKIKEDKNDVIDVFPKVWLIRSRLLKIQSPRRDGCGWMVLRRCEEVRQRTLVSIDGVDLKTVRGQKQ
jgi:hypothetical protein